MPRKSLEKPRRKGKKIFDPAFKVPDAVTKFEPKVVIIGLIQPPLEDDEKGVLSLPSKTAINGNMKMENFKIEVGKMSTKIRWDISKEEGEKVSDEDKVETTEEEDNLIEEEEARSRIPYDPLLNECDLRKRRVTDIQENSRIYMPKPLNVAHEANINIRETIFENAFSRYVDSFCNETGKQKPNLTRSEMSGLAKLKKRVDDGSVVICETDKSMRSTSGWARST